VQNNPSDGQAHEYTCQLMMQMRHADTIRHCELAAHLRPWKENQRVLCVAYMEAGLYDKAIQSCKQALTPVNPARSNPSAGSDSDNNGTMGSGRSDVAAVAAITGTDASRHSVNANVYLNMCQVYTKMNQLTAAEQYCVLAVQAASEHWQMHNELCIVNTHQNKLEQAIKSCKRACELDSTVDGPRMNTCAALSKAGRFQEAVKYCEDGVRINPSDAFNLSNLCGVYLQTNDPKKAFPICEKAVVLGPKVEAVKYMYCTMLKITGRQVNTQLGIRTSYCP
jgi:tetratricopeptide (TPR) repeat protein